MVIKADRQDIEFIVYETIRQIFLPDRKFFNATDIQVMFGWNYNEVTSQYTLGNFPKPIRKNKNAPRKWLKEDVMDYYIKEFRQRKKDEKAISDS